MAVLPSESVALDPVGSTRLFAHRSEDLGQGVPGSVGSTCSMGVALACSILKPRIGLCQAGAPQPVPGGLGNPAQVIFSFCQSRAWWMPWRSVQCWGPQVRSCRSRAVTLVGGAVSDVGVQ